MAISKPTKLPEWASTTANVVEPSEGKKDDGWLVNEIPPSSYENWRAKTNWQWWQWWDEKVDDYIDTEHIEFQFPIVADGSNTANPSEVAIRGFGFGPKAIGVLGKSNTSDLNEGVTQVEEIGVVGIVAVYYAGKTPTSETGVLGIGESGVIGLGSGSGDLDTSVFSDVGVAGINGAFTGSISDVGVFGFSDANTGVLGHGDVGGEFHGIGSGSIGMQAVGDSPGSGSGGKAIDADGGDGTGSNTGGVGVQGTGGKGGSSGGVGGTGVVGTGGALSGAIGGTGGSFSGGNAATAATTGGNGVYGEGGDHSSTGPAGNGGSFVGGTNTSSGLGGNGLYSTGGSSTSGESGYGAELAGATPNSKSHAPLRLVPQTTPGGVATSHLNAGEIYYNSATNELEFFDGTNWQRIRYVGGP